MSTPTLDTYVYEQSWETKYRWSVLAPDDATARRLFNALSKLDRLETDDEHEYDATLVAERFIKREGSLCVKSEADDTDLQALEAECYNKFEWPPFSPNMDTLLQFLRLEEEA